ncbi:MAG: hypothetical protein AAF529_05530 [Pseudomonadota bacterium]
MYRFRHISALITLLCSAPCLAETPLFPDDHSSASPLQVTLATDLSTLMKKGAAEQSATLTLQSEEGSQVFQVKVAPRGKSRQERCRFFPLWLNLKKSELAGTVFAGQDKLKLVTHCSNTYSPRGYVAAEMLSYRLLNLVTDFSFRVRAVEMTYINTKNNNSSAHPAFLIEHKKSLAKRLGAAELNDRNPKIRELDGELATQHALFQYMLGNTDFSLVQGIDPTDCCHNAVPMIAAGAQTDRVFSVPYDFDVTGFVNVPYAKPPQHLKISRLTQRLYRGYCRHNEHLPDGIAHFQGLREKIFATIQTFADLPDLNRAKQLKFIDGFFKVLDSERSVRSKFYKRCR